MDEKHMATALELAARGRGSVEPNPMVGAVIVRGGRQIARGWHGYFGGPHAEIEAISAAEKAGEDIRGATMYVTLEPCCHHGKTPPCTEAIVSAGLKRVVAAMEDPNPRVAGKGISRLREAGVEVIVGVLERQARELLAGYIKRQTQGRPWVICKWAQTADGILALPPGRGRWISSEQARRYVHKLRGTCDGVCVGIGTVLADDPLLSNRSGRGRQPARLVLDRQLRLPENCQLARTAQLSPVIVATTSQALVTKADKAERLRRAGIELLEMPAGSGGIFLPALLEELGRREWSYLLVEGGAAVLRSVVLGRLADELLVFVSPMQLDGTKTDLPRFDILQVRQELGLNEPARSRFGRDELQRYRLACP